MKWMKGNFLHEGKGKSVYAVKERPDSVWLEFKDKLTAFNGKKTSSFGQKGLLNRDTSSLAFRFLEKEEIKSHWVADIGETGMICRRLEILPLEVVVRNRLAGSTARRFQFPEGQALSEPLVEFYYKKDELGDPFVSSEQAVVFGFVSNRREVELLKKKALEINKKLEYFFGAVGLELIDFKLEFGKKKDSETENQESVFLLGDEISCDSCRLWDRETGEKRDKDRFRLDLGGVEESYKKVHKDLISRWEKELAV